MYFEMVKARAVRKGALEVSVGKKIEVDNLFSFCLFTFQLCIFEVHLTPLTPPPTTNSVFGMDIKKLISAWVIDFEISIASVRVFPNRILFIRTTERLSGKVKQITIITK